MPSRRRPTRGARKHHAATSGGNQIFQGGSSGNQFIPWGQNYGGANIDTTNRMAIDPNDTIPTFENSLSSNRSGIVATLGEQKQMGSDVVRPIVDFAYMF